MINQNIALIGGGALGVEVAAIIAHMARSDQACEVSYIIDFADSVRLDDIEEILGYRPQHIKTLADLPSSGIAVECVVCVGEPRIRAKIMAEVTEAGLELCSVVSPLAYVDSTAGLGAGCVIFPFAYIGPKAKLADNSVVNVGGIVGHDVVLGQSSVVSPTANLNGFSSVGDVTLIGAGAIVNPHVKIGRIAKISSGSVLIRDAGDGYLVAGNPAKGRQMFRD